MDFIKQKKALELGAGGFIGGHMVDRLKSKGYFVRGVDKKYPDFSQSKADEFYQNDLTDIESTEGSFCIGGGFDEVYPDPAFTTNTEETVPPMEIDDVNVAIVPNPTGIGSP